MNEYAKTTREELDKAIAGKPNEFKVAMEKLIENSENLIKESETARTDLEQLMKETEVVANNCLGLTRIIKDMHIWLTTCKDMFPAPHAKHQEYQDIIIGLATFVASPMAIKAGVIENAQRTE